VVEYTLDRTLTELDEIHHVLLCDERDRFLEATGLEQLRPIHQVICATLGNYPQIAQHIEEHCFDLKREWNRDIRPDVAAASWYDTIYMPIINAARRQHLFQYFPDHHEGDLYLWAIEHRWQIREYTLALRWSKTEGHAPKQMALRDRLNEALNDVTALGQALQTLEQDNIVHV
jgi:hypothetical protein